MSKVFYHLCESLGALKLDTAGNNLIAVGDFTSTAKDVSEQADDLATVALELAHAGKNALRDPVTKQEPVSFRMGMAVGEGLVGEKKQLMKA